jgi:coenzyme F420-reducing hydrogenase gamma subunit
VKPKVAFFDFACCEGCQLDALNLTEQQLLDLLAAVDIVEFREVKTEQAEHYDIAFVEGSVTRADDVPRLKDIRERADILVALGACAHIGGVNCLKNLKPLDEQMHTVYGEAASDYDTARTQPIDRFVEVDAYIPQCPINTQEFLRTVTDLLQGIQPRLPNYPVCVDCKMAGNICVYERGGTCVGPITRAGCGAICVTAGRRCWGCRGVIDNPNDNAQKEILEKAGLSVEDVMERFNIYLACREETS